MSQQTASSVAKRRIVYSISAIDRVRVTPDVAYASSEESELTMDVYQVAATNHELRPAVVLIGGYPDSGMQRIFGCRTNQLGAFVSWAELLAASGFVAITYANTQPADVKSVFAYVAENAVTLGVDAGRLSVWSCSGHAPNALTALTWDRPRIRCAALVTPYTLDRVGSTNVAAAAGRFGFASSPTTVEDLPPDVPIFIARAGKDAMPGLNAALDMFTADALARNLSITLVNHATGPHAFDLFDDGETSREAIRAAVQFLQAHSKAEPSPARV